MASRIVAPWSPSEVAALNAHQARVDRHPYTCPDGVVLEATRDGWRCNVCTYTQTWAHAHDLGAIS